MDSPDVDCNCDNVREYTGDRGEALKVCIACGCTYRMVADGPDDFTWEEV